jgi:hypothetical protein
MKNAFLGVALIALVNAVLQWLIFDFNKSLNGHNNYVVAFMALVSILVSIFFFLKGITVKDENRVKRHNHNHN